MANYLEGMIYKIESNKTNKVYIGSTTLSIKQRFQIHQSSYKRYQKGLGQYISAFDIFDADDSPSIEVIQNFPCINRTQLDTQERAVIEAYQDVCCNHNIPKRSIEEYLYANRESIQAYHRRYFVKHRKRIIAKQKFYYRKNLELNRAKRRSYARYHASPFGQLCLLFNSLR